MLKYALFKSRIACFRSLAHALFQLEIVLQKSECIVGINKRTIAGN